MEFKGLLIAVTIGIGVLLEMEKKRIDGIRGGGNAPSDPTKKYNMEFEYRKIGAKRRREVNSMRIRDLSVPDYNTVFKANGKYFVTNKDESILFCPFFVQENIEQGEHKAVFLCIKDYERITVTVDYSDSDSHGIYEDMDLMTVWNHLLSESSLIRYYINYDEHSLENNKIPS